MGAIEKNNNEKLSIFNHSELGQVRVILKDNEPLFCLSDVCKILEISNPTDLKDSILREFELSRLNLGSFNTGFGIKEFTMITEPQLYFVLMRSDKPKAKPFRKWVNTEVLPSIRKHGIYATESTIDKMMNDPDFFMGLMQKLKEESQRRKEAENRVLLLTHTQKSYTITEIAKELGFKSGQALNKALCDKRIQYQVNGTWVMYSDYSDLGYESIKQEILDNGKIIYNRRITGIGREFLLSVFNTTSEKRSSR